MNLTEHYDQLYHNSSKATLAGNYTIDPLIKDSTDKRFGVTLLIRPNEKVKNNMQLFLDELKEVDASQYYYPNSDIHITLMSIISCYEGFTLNQISVTDYIKIIQESLIGIGEIKIDFRGVTASPSAIMIQGFPADETLNTLRNTFRENFKKSTLQQSIDSRYAIATAHSTVMRFQEKLQNPDQLMQVVEKFRNYDFGTFKVENIELVFNDWYQRESNTVHLKDFDLSK
jgi:2'-5' RNA ligase